MKLQELYRELRESSKFLSRPNLAASVERLAGQLADEGIDELASAEGKLHKAEEWLDRVLSQLAEAHTKADVLALERDHAGAVLADVRDQLRQATEVLKRFGGQIGDLPPYEELARDNGRLRLELGNARRGFPAHTLVLERDQALGQLADARDRVAALGRVNQTLRDDLRTANDRLAHASRGMVELGELGRELQEAGGQTG